MGTGRWSRRPWPRSSAPSSAASPSAPPPPLPRLSRRPGSPGAMSTGPSTPSTPSSGRAARTGVPGVAVAVVHKDEVVHLDGFGKGHVGQEAEDTSRDRLPAAARPGGPRELPRPRLERRLRRPGPPAPEPLRCLRPGHQHQRHDAARRRARHRRPHQRRPGRPHGRHRLRLPRHGPARQADRGLAGPHRPGLRAGGAERPLHHRLLQTPGRRRRAPPGHRLHGHLPQRLLRPPDRHRDGR